MHNWKPNICIIGIQKGKESGTIMLIEYFYKILNILNLVKTINQRSINLNESQAQEIWGNYTMALYNQVAQNY